MFKIEDHVELENFNSKFKLDLDKINNTNNTLNSENIETNKYTKQYYDMTLTNPVEGISQILRRDSKLNLSLSRISLKNNFPQENSKLRSIYKKGNQSILNITDIKSADNQFIKLFTNSSLYQNPKKDSVILSKTTAEVLKDKKPAQTAKKLASDVISIYRANISNQIKDTSEKNEAKEIVAKQTGAYRKFANEIIKKKYVPEVDVETIMRSPVQKYAKSNFPCHNQTLVSIVSRANVPSINPNSSVLSPIKNLKSKFKTDMKTELQEAEGMKVKNVLKQSINRYKRVKKSYYSQDYNIQPESIHCNQEDSMNAPKDCFEGLIFNKYKSLVSTIKVCASD